MTSNFLKVWQAVLAGLLFISASADFIDLVPANVARSVILIVGALATATGYYTARAGSMPADPVGRGY